MNNISSFQLDLARRKKSKSSKSKSKTLTKEVDFTNKTNLLYMLGGFISHFFGFYKEYKAATAVFSCITDAYPKIEATFKSAFTEVTSKISNTIAKCKNSNPVTFIWDAGADLLKVAGNAVGNALGLKPGDEVEKMAAELEKQQGDCYKSAKDLLGSITKVVGSVKQLVIDVRQCIENYQANKSTKPDYITQVAIDFAKSAATSIASWATGGLTDLGPAIVIVIKFILVCAAADKDFKPEHKYRVLGKYISQLVRLVLKLGAKMRKVKYNYYKRMMKKYQKKL